MGATSFYPHESRQPLRPLSRLAQRCVVDCFGGVRPLISNDIWSPDLRWSGIGWSKILARDAELPHHGVQGCSWESETCGCLADHPAGLPHHTNDMFPLYSRQGGVAGGSQCIRPDLSQRSTESGASRKDNRPFNEVFELPYVPRPRPADESAHGVRRNLVDLPIHFSGVLFGEVPREYRDVLGVITQWRGRDGEDFQPVIDRCGKVYHPSSALNCG